MNKIRVRPGCCIMGAPRPGFLDESDIYSAGKVLTEQHLLLEAMKVHVASGYAEWVNDSDQDKPDPGPVAVPPGVVVQPALNMAPSSKSAEELEVTDLNKGLTGKQITIQNEKPESETKTSVRVVAMPVADKPEQPKSEPSASGAPLSRFDLDPASLKDQSIALLNEKLIERGEKPVDTREEAVAILTQDFHPPAS